MARAAMNLFTLKHRARNLFETHISSSTTCVYACNKSIPKIPDETAQNPRSQENPPKPSTRLQKKLSTTLKRLDLRTTQPIPRLRIRQANQTIPPTKCHALQNLFLRLLPPPKPRLPPTLRRPRIIHMQMHRAFNLIQKLRRRELRRAVDQRRYACGHGVEREDWRVA